MGKFKGNLRGFSIGSSMSYLYRVRIVKIVILTDINIKTKPKWYTSFLVEPDFEVDSNRGIYARSFLIFNNEQPTKIS